MKSGRSYSIAYKLIWPWTRIMSRASYSLVIYLITSLSTSYGQDDVNFKCISPWFNNRHVNVSEITQDDNGHIWMNASSGLLKYNGHSYQFIGREEIFNGISSNDDIDQIQTDQSKNIWIKTKKGLLCVYDTKLGVYEDLSDKLNEPISIVKTSNNEVWVVSHTGTLLHIDKNRHLEVFTTIPDLNGIDNKVEAIAPVNNDVYLSTSKGRVYCYSGANHSLSEIEGPFKDYPGLIILQADRNHRLWIGTEAFGLLVYDFETKNYIQSTFINNEQYDLSKELFLNLYLDSQGNIWGGTDGDGLYKINSISGEVYRFQKDNFNKFSLGSNTITDVYEDNHHNIWVVNNYGTINVIPKSNTQVKYHRGSETNIPLRILSVHKDRFDNLWLGTDGDGLSRIDTKTSQSVQYFDDKDFYVQSITEDKLGHIWFGTYKNGLWHYNQKSGHFTKLEVDNLLNQSATDIRVVFADSKGRIWVSSNVAINIYDRYQNRLASFAYGESGLKGIIAESIVEDEAGTIWLGIYGGGLHQFREDIHDLQNSIFSGIDYLSDEVIPSIRSMSFGEEGELWAINNKGKLLHFDTRGKENRHTSIPKVLNNQTFCSVIYTGDGHIWLSSRNGIHHFNYSEQTTNTYYTVDGFQSNSFMRRSAHIDDDGVLYYGSSEGLNYFHPSNLIKERSEAKLLITDIEILNKPAKSLLGDQIKSDVNQVKELYLKNDQSSFSVKFAAIDNILNPNYHYSYRLRGFDNDWKHSRIDGTATYTNIPAGNYTLDIRARETANSDISYDQQLQISIDLPFWKKPMALLFYTLLIIILAYAAYKWYALRKRLLINRISRHQEKQLHESKVNFYAKMSHEIQTPITLILGPIEDMLKQANQNGNLLLKERLNIIANNAQRLSLIARELTLLRNRESNNLKLAVSQHQLYEDLHKIGLSFKELARIKKIDFGINCPRNLSNSWYDKEKVEHILYNLLSNAFKFTPPEGNISLSVIPINNKSWIKITVADSGPGIDEKELDKIFELFYTSSNEFKKHKGTGIGLALTKELVTLHKGEIDVSSSTSEGTEFTVKIPILELYYGEEEKIVSSKSKVCKTHHADVRTGIIDTPPSINTNHTKKSILIVEDNYELLRYLKELLQNQYNILLAENGKEGYYHARNNIPDLIISDIMMPEMDGIEMCQRLQKHDFTKHIPVILLTAKNSTRAKIEGLKTGALEYINKPFHADELILKVSNIIASKKNIITKYRKDLINKPKIKQEKSLDEQFLEGLTAAVNDRLGDSNFKVQDLADSLNMSYSSLYRKCLSLTGTTIIDFVRLLRLKKAAILMANFGYSVSEAAFTVGFNDPKYFSKSFKSQFHMTPRDFKTKGLSQEGLDDIVTNQV